MGKIAQKYCENNYLTSCMYMCACNTRAGEYAHTYTHRQ